MIYLDVGGNMSSRMDKYRNELPQDVKRSQKNQLLYEQLDDDLEDNRSKLISSLGDTIESDLAKLDAIIKKYDNYKREQGQNSKHESIRKLNIELEENSLLSLNLKDYINYKNIITGNRRTLKKVHEQDEKIEKLIETILKTSNSNKDVNQSLNLSRLNRQLSKYDNNLRKPSKFTRSKDTSERKKFFDFDITEEDDDDKKLNLKIKALVGIIFIVNSIIIIFVIYNSIK